MTAPDVCDKSCMPHGYINGSCGTKEYATGARLVDKCVGRTVEVVIGHVEACDMTSNALNTPEKGMDALLLPLVNVRHADAAKPPVGAEFTCTPAGRAREMRTACVGCVWLSCCSVVAAADSSRGAREHMRLQRFFSSPERARLPFRFAHAACLEHEGHRPECLYQLA